MFPAAAKVRNIEIWRVWADAENDDFESAVICLN